MERFHQPFALIFATLLESQAKLFPDVIGKGGEVSISVKVSLGISDPLADAQNIVAVSAKLLAEIQGSVTTASAKNEFFTMSCTYTADFKLKEGAVVTPEEIKNNPDSLSSQIYPFIRDHIVEVLSKMNINAVNMPWHITLPPIE